MEEFLRKCRRYFFHAGFFSLFVNVLALALPLYTLQVYDRVLTSRSAATLVALTGITLGLLLVMTLLESLRSRILLAAGLALEAETGPLVVDRLVQNAALPNRQMVQQPASLRDSQQVSGFLAGPGVVAFFDAPWVPIFIGVIFLTHWLLGLIALIGTVLHFGIAIANERMTRGGFDAAATETRRAIRYVESAAQNAEVMVVLGMLPGLIKRWRKIATNAAELQARASSRGAVFTGITRYLRQTLQILMMGVGAWVVIAQEASPGIMIAATIILGRALAPVEIAVAGWRNFVEARGAYARLDKLIGEHRSDALSKTVLPEPVGHLRVENATLVFRNPDRIILKGISFELAAGESLGVIGPSAAGKSTLTRLLTGIWQPSTGTVRLDGAELHHWERDALSNYLGYLPQDIELVGGTVSENIARLGEVDSDLVVAAAVLANAHDLIQSLPRGYDTEIGDRGQQLSAGQRQRVALARALYGTPRLVVLDEPNSNLDANGEEALLACLATLKTRQITTIIVSHKPSLLVGVDRVAILRDGRLELFGPTAEVMRQVTRALVPLHAVKDDGAQRG
ncbi:MAG: type I secretion system permease/ATPase [Gammaproteobacteria bacterium]|nr:type I secretion system permease/ATPase [Gammaproteobacteria bacterium]